MGRKPRNLVGHVVGQVTVLEQLPGKDLGQTLWKCRCDCGTEFVGRFCTLTTGAARKKPYNCGCLTRCKQPKDMGIRKQNTQQAARYVYGQYSARAANKNRTFTLTLSEFLEITQRSCFYCGRNPATTKSYGRVGTPDTYTYNGIDREDNDLGYIPENCLACCIMCNRMKLNHGKTEFLQHVERICKHQKINKLDTFVGVG